MTPLLSFSWTFRSATPSSNPLFGFLDVLARVEAGIEFYWQSERTCLRLPLCSNYAVKESQKNT